MAAIQLFHATLDGARQLKVKRFQSEKDLQGLFEKHLHDLTGIAFVDSEHYTGSRHKRRADTLGLDDKQRPVVIEYKLGQGGAAISQGLDYLDWLSDHKGDFRELVRGRLGTERVKGIDFKNAWLLCVAGEFRREDILNAKTNTHRIELLSVRRHGESTILLEWAHRRRGDDSAKPSRNGSRFSACTDQNARLHKYELWKKTVQNAPLHRLFMALHDHLLSMGDDVEVNPTKKYVGFHRNQRNLASIRCATARNHLLVHILGDLDPELLREGFMRKAPGSWGPGRVMIIIRNEAHLERAKPLLRESYQRSGARAAR